MRYVNATGIWFFSDCYIGRVLRADGGHDLINDELCADLRSYCRQPLVEPIRAFKVKHGI